jgi:signal transduction histidine kinase/integral membrane sensor domain MASE1/CheY-like chemotaxis protein
MNSTRYLAGSLLFIAAYIVAGKAGLALATVNSSATPVWAPTGIALAWMLLLGSRTWPLIFLSAVVVNQTTGGSWPASLLIATGNTGEALVGAYLINRFAHGRHAFERSRNTLLFLGLAAGATVVSACVGVTVLSLLHQAAWSDFFPIALTWLVGDVTGAILVAPVLLLWATGGPVQWTRQRRTEMVAVVVLAVLVGWVVFFQVGLPITFLCLPVCVWAGFRFGPREAATITVALSVMAIWGTLLGRGSFALNPANTSLLVAQAFSAVSMVVTLVVGVAVAERRKLESSLEHRVASRTAQLRTTRNRLAQAQEVARIGSWDWDVNTKELWWSDELYRMWNVDPHVFRPSYEAFLEGVHADDRAFVESTIQGSLLSGQPFEFEFRLVQPDATEQTIFSKGQVVRGASGDPVRMVGTAQDITERKQLELRLGHARRLEAIGLLTGGIAHDFNNLITAMGGYAELVLRQLPDKHPYRDDLLEVRKAADRAAALTRRLLMFSREQALPSKVVDLNALVLGVESLLRRTIGEQIDLRLDLDTRLAPVRADPVQIEQVLLNLSLNARDAMASGGVLRFTTRLADLTEEWTRSYPPMEAGSYVHLCVEDSGIGMSPETQARIFEPFFTTKPAGSGTGFGLSTVYGIVKQSAGFIWVRSQLGRGTSFDIYFPALDQTSEHAASEVPVLDELVASGTILIVEDDSAVRRLSQAVLETAGYRVLDARDGEEALAVARRKGGRLDLLITDVIMPGITGRELVERLESRHPTLRVLYTSGYTRDGMVSVGVESSAPFLQKPFMPPDLLQKVREVLSASVRET